QPVTGLPQEEPLFTINHIPPSAFSGFVRAARIFLKVDYHKKPYLKIERDTFAEPQTAVFVGGPNTASAIKILKKNKHQIIKRFKQTEIKENQRRIAKSLANSEILKKKFGLTLKFSSVYRYAVKD